MGKKNNQKKNFNWLFFTIIFLLIIISGILIVFFSLKRPFCAASGNCKESMQLNVQNGVSGVFNGQKVTPQS